MIKEEACVQHVSVAFNPFSPYSDQHQISPCKVNAQSIRKDMEIKHIIAQDEFSCYFNKFSLLLL